jgi:hypothetical protein
MGLSRFGGLWTYANAVAIDVPRSDEDVVELTFEHSAELGMDAKADTGELVIKVPGYYFGVATISFIGTTGVTYFFEFRSNGELGGGYRASADGLTGGAVNVSLVGAGIFDVGDVITVRVYCDEDGETATIVDATVGLISI